MCVTEGNLTRLCREHILERIEAIYEANPALRGYEPEAPRCGVECCGEDAVADDFGWDVARAWSEIQNARWLLGDDE